MFTVVVKFHGIEEFSFLQHNYNVYVQLIVVRLVTGNFSTVLLKVMYSAKQWANQKTFHHCHYWCYRIDRVHAIQQRSKYLEK